mgnify:CR=1 FL=1
MPMSSQSPVNSSALTRPARAAARSSGALSCSDLLIQAGIARAVIAARDPHPKAAGAGIARMRAAGIVVEIGLMELETRAQNAAFFAKWDQT